MHRTRIKICGITRVQDAVAAADVGADAIGLIFHPPAHRNISIETGAKIIDALPPFVTPVAVFVGASAAQVRSVCEPLHIRHVQLNGNDSPDMIAELRNFTILKAVKVEPEQFEETLNTWRHHIHALHLSNLHGFVLETPGSAPGGTGRENNWDAVMSAAKRGTFEGLPKLIAAGGLRPETVAEIVTWIRPYAVDVSTGVEHAPGCKSSDKIREFVAAVRSADQS